MTPKKKYSFAALFTVVSMSVIVFITISLSVLFFINFRIMSYQQIETTLQVNVKRLQDKVSGKLKEWQALVQHTAINASPFILKEPIDTDNLETLLRRTKNSQNEVVNIYCSNNLVWNKPGGYFYLYPTFIPEDTYDNTQRPWFLQAKSHPSQIVYVDPYVDVVTHSLITSVVSILYDAWGRDIGVLGADISVAFLEDMLRDMTSLPNQEIYFLNKTGLFITHPDSTAVLVRDFFTESKLERYRENVLGSYSFFKVDKDVFIYSVHIPEVAWTLVSTVPASVIFTKINRFLLEMICVNVALIVIAVAMAVILIRILQNERDENAAMKDNLKVGFFLMDKQYLIQGQYSNALENLFSVNGLKGKNFVSLLSASLTKKETDTLKDYFDMVINRSFDQELLDDINPIQELSYISVETGAAKTLNCGFTAVNRGGRKDVYILGNILDITAEKELKTRLAEEETGRQEDMRFLFEVIQGDPGVLHDFIEDMDYSFEEIGGILTDESITPKSAVVNIYQAVHAIKSNAVILGLKTFGDQLHELETNLQALKDQEAVFKDDLERLSGEIKKIKRNRIKLITALQKIQSFKSANKRHQGSYVLAESLIGACRKVSKDLAKQAEFIVERLDPEAVDKGPRRAMKDVLMQLVRNAVYHGIESPEERDAQGKDRTGHISLALTLETDGIHIRLRDDGKGIDYSKIRAKAEQLGLIPEGGEDDPESLLQYIFAPGFSTSEEVGIHAGRGIGLNLVKDRIEELQGTIQIQSEPGAGTAFIIFIPLSAVKG